MKAIITAALLTLPTLASASPSVDLSSPLGVCNWMADVAEAAAKDRDDGRTKEYLIGQASTLDHPQVRELAIATIQGAYLHPRLPPHQEAQFAFQACWEIAGGSLL